MRSGSLREVVLVGLCFGSVIGCRPAEVGSGTTASLWDVYQRSFKTAKYVDLTDTITPTIPVWPGFGDPTFGPTTNSANGKPYS